MTGSTARSRTRFYAGQAAAVALLALMALLASSLWSSRETAVRLAELSLLHETRLQAQRIDAVVTMVDFTLRSLADDLGAAATAPGALPATPTLLALGRRSLATAHSVTVAAYGADGTLAGTVGRRGLLPAAVADRPFFLRHRDQLAVFQYATAGQVGLDGRPFLVLSRAVVAQGRFAGVVVVLVDLEHPFDHTQEDGVEPGPQAKILFDAAGTMLAAWHRGDWASRDWARDGPFADLLVHPERTAVAPDGEWIVVVHQLAEFPFRLAAAVRRDAALAGWWHEARMLVLTLVVASALLVALVGVLAVQARRRRTAEEGLRDQLAFQKVLLDTIPLPVFWKDAERRYLGCNAAFEALVGRRSAALVGRTADALFPPEDAAEHGAVDRAVLADGMSRTDERLSRFPDGVERAIIYCKAAFARADGTPGGLVGVMVDVTERRRIEERTAALLKALEHTPSSILITDADGTVTYVNPTFCETTGYAADEIVGQNPRILQSGETPADTYRALWETVTAGRVWHGEFRNRRKNGQVYWERAAIAPILGQDGQPISYVAVKEDISADKVAAARVWEQAHLDALTGLANRVTLRDRLSAALDGAQRLRGRLALLYIDLDRFKPVNDRFGHETGDTLLVQVADRLRENVRGDDLVARLGGDEFVVLMAIHTPAEAEAVAARILAAMTRPFVLEVGPVEIGASIGASVYPVDATDAEALIRHADNAMYVAKQAGRSTVRFYDASMRGRDAATVTSPPG